MHGGAVTLAKQFNKSAFSPDLILATDMLDFTTFLSLTRASTHSVPTAIYFHENQLSYPWSITDRDVQKNRDSHYGFINYASALAADHVLFNSRYHMSSFLKEAKALLKHFPDHNELDSIPQIKEKSIVLPVGLDLKRLSNFKPVQSAPPLILWNHRWEYDKNPETFFNTLFQLDREGIDFRVAVLGESFSKAPTIFEDAHKRLKEKIVHFGYCKRSEEYVRWLWNADIIPVTNIQEFFGISVMEAMFCNTYPLLPNRLTYPELLPKNLHEAHLYHSENELVEKLKWCISNIDEVRKKEFSGIAVQFDWNKLAPKYDELFSSFL